jgi:hypothetical protein
LFALGWLLALLAGECYDLGGDGAGVLALYEVADL